MTFIDAHCDRILNHMYRNVSFTSPTTVYTGLIETVTDLEAGTITEATYTGYARAATAFDAPAAGQNGRQIQNTAQESYGQKTDAGSVSFIAYGVWDAATLGNLFDVVFLDGGEPVYAIVQNTTTDIFEHAAHGFVDDDRMRLIAVPGSGGLPTGASENTTYWVVNAAADNFQLSTTQGGAAIGITAVGEAFCMPLTPLTVNQNDTPQAAAGAIKLALR